MAQPHRGPGWRDLESGPGPPETPINCASFALFFVFVLIVAVVIAVGGVLLSNRVDALAKRVDALEDARDPPRKAERRAPPTVVAAKPALAARPVWAKAPPTPHWLQFESPLDDVPIRLSSVEGLSAAITNGFKIECNFGKSVIVAGPEQILVEISINDETAEEFATIQSLAPAFRGRECVLEWMA